MPLGSFSFSGRILHAGLLRANLKLLGSASEVRARRKSLLRKHLCGRVREVTAFALGNFRGSRITTRKPRFSAGLEGPLSLLPVGRGVD